MELLNDRTLIRVSGDDRVKFLQSLITNDIYKITDNTGGYALLLTPQGKYFCDLFIYNHNGVEFLIDLPLLIKDEFLAKMKIYKLRAKVYFDDLIEDFVVVAYENDNDIKSDISFVDPRMLKMGYRGYFKKDRIDVYQDDSINSYNYRRIKNIIPEGHKDLIYGKSFPLEFGMNEHNAIDFNKGCYVGQEVVSRTYHRGVIRKKIYLFTSESEVYHGDEVSTGEKGIGIVTSFVDGVGLALLRIEEIKENNCFVGEKSIYLKL